MLKLLNIIVALALVINVCYAEKVSYSGYKLVRLSFKPSQAHLLQSWENSQGFDLWSHYLDGNIIATVLLSPVSYIKFKSQFNINKIEYEVIDENIQTKLDEEERLMKLNRADSVVGRYSRYNAIVDYLESLVNDYPQLASVYNAGKTHEKKDIKVLVLKTKTSKKGIWLDCGIHAREWISPATCISFIDKLINGYIENKSSVVDLLQTYEFHIMPVVNPDGYEYTHTTNRLWRKNRSINSGSSCIGTDLNRNFPYGWYTGGSSNKPCDDTYAGTSAGSEPETQAIISSIKKKSGDWDSFLTIHSYGLYWLIPYGNTTTRPGDYNELSAVATIGQNALKSVRNTVYSFGTPSELLYIASGGSFDWSKGDEGIKYSYCLELSPGQKAGDVDSGTGFQLPEARIPIVGQEVFEGLIATITEIKKRLNR